MLTETIIVIHSQKEVFVVKNTENIKENLNELSEVTPLDCMLLFLKFSMPALRVAIGM